MKTVLLLLTCLVLACLGLTACGDDDSPDSARAGAVKDLSENAVDSWSANRVQGLHNFLHPSVSSACTVDGLEAAMEDQPQPTDWRTTKDISFPTENTASATVVIVADGADVEQPWTFELEGGVRWRVTGFPGLSECTS